MFGSHLWHLIHCDSKTDERNKRAGWNNAGERTAEACDVALKSERGEVAIRGIIVWCVEGRSEGRGKSLCGGETRRRPGGEMGFKGGDEKRDEGQAGACDVDGNGRGILMVP